MTFDKAIAALSCPFRQSHLQVRQLIRQTAVFSKQEIGDGRFRTIEGKTMSGKWFSDSAEGAARHGDALHGPGRYRIIEADVADNAPSLFQKPNLDGRGPARWLDIEDLDDVVARPVGH